MTIRRKKWKGGIFFSATVTPDNFPVLAFSSLSSELRRFWRAKPGGHRHGYFPPRRTLAVSPPKKREKKRKKRKKKGETKQDISVNERRITKKNYEMPSTQTVLYTELMLFGKIARPSDGSCPFVSVKGIVRKGSAREKF